MRDARRSCHCRKRSSAIAIGSNITPRLVPAAISGVDALALVMAAPRRALAQASLQLDHLDQARAPLEAAQALRVMGLAARELHDAAQAARYLRRSIGV